MILVRYALKTASKRTIFKGLCAGNFSVACGRGLSLVTFVDTDRYNKLNRN